MRRLLALAALSLTPVFAAPPADCGPKGFLFASDSNVFYRSVAAFPEPARLVKLGLLVDPYVGPVTVCGFSFVPDRKNGTLTVRSARLTDFPRIFREGSANTGVIVAENRASLPGVLGSGTSVRVAFNPRTFLLEGLGPIGEPTPFTLGARVDGGALQPLLFNGQGTPVQVPKRARVVEVYARATQGYTTRWGRWRLDLRAPSVQFQLEFPFPGR